MIALDTNVILDVMQRREPHFKASAAVLERVLRGETQAALSAHAVTTLHYLVARFQDRKKADQAIDWLLKHLEVLPTDRNTLVRAHSLAGNDFEDMVLAAAAESASCNAIVTRNVRDFRPSPVPAMTPDEFLLTPPGRYRIQDVN
jgi:predicted nucleic acid-binding protein